MRYFFVSTDLIKDKLITFNPEESHHIRDVLRYVVGDECMCTDGDGTQFRVKLTKVDATTVAGEITHQEIKKSSSCLTVAQAYPQKGKMDIIVEKANEMGVRSLIPLLTERTEVKPNDKQWQKIFERWERIAQQTLKQSHVSQKTEIQSAVTFKNILKTFSNYDRVYVFHPEAELRVQVERLADEGQSVLALIGPEGGFSEHEIEQAKVHHATVVSLGEEVLKTDTAFVAVVSLLKFLQS